MHEYVVAYLTRHSKGLIQEFNVNLSIYLDRKRSLQNHVFSKYDYEFPPFKYYSQLMLNKRRMMVKYRTTGMRVAHLEMAVHAYEKGFSLSTNYTKGFGDMFIKWIMDKHPGCVLYHVEKV